MTKIVCAAIKLECGEPELIVSAPRPYRHHDIIHSLYQRGVKQSGKIQGFLTSDGNFVDRKEAAKIALRSKQITKLEYPPNLFSEDLW